jgi:ribosomal protein L34E
LSLTLRHPELFDVKALHISPSWTDKAALRNRSCLPTSFATKIAKRLHKVTEPKHRPHLCGNQISGVPRHRRDVDSVAASARWRGVSRPYRHDAVPVATVGSMAWRFTKDS